MASNRISALRVTNPKSFQLSKHDPGDTLGWEKDTAEAELEEVKAELDVLQQRLFAEERRSVLLVLQAMDAAGKDGTIRNILSGSEPGGRQGHQLQGAGRAARRSTTTCGGCTPTCPGEGRSASSTAATTRTCWSCG